MPPDCISFVNGVDVFGAQPPQAFPHRFAVVRLAEPRLRELSGANVSYAEIWDRRRRWIFFWKPIKIREAPLSEWLAKSDKELNDQDDFPVKLRFERNGKVALWMETERWDLIGGIPDIYHDSVTLSFFSKYDLSKKLEDLFRTEAGKLGVLIKEAPQPG